MKNLENDNKRKVKDIDDLKHKLDGLLKEYNELRLKEREQRQSLLNNQNNQNNANNFLDVNVRIIIEYY
jgi:regulator of replication initiation timing